MSSWWQQRSRDERRWLAGTAAIVVLCLLWLVVWQPLLDDRRALSERLQAQQLALADMQQMAQEVRRLQASEPAGGGVRRDRRSLLALADESARARGLGDALRRVEPQGDQRVRMLLEDAQFAAVTGWLETLQFRLGVEVEEISIERRALAGQVTVQLTLLDRRPPLQETN